MALNEPTDPETYTCGLEGHYFRWAEDFKAWVCVKCGHWTRNKRTV